MRQEILQLKGRIAELRQTLQQKELEASGLIIQIRSLADPYENDMTHIKSEQLSISARLLHECVTQIKTTTEQLKRLEADLG